ncbi:MAG: hypothetical protein H6899_17265 [Rhodobacter sp.]|nr:hypothetical protein [Paracoccaceae bacterium]MCB1408746.1 hypothetical protein [Paracoccaceae bacterium]MCC0081656.1 hypothetical protein [Rhodobacter sp.]
MTRFSLASTLRSALAPAAVALLALTAQPAQAEWQGGGTVHSPQGCERYGWPAGPEMVRVRVRNGADENERNSHVTIAFMVGGINTYRVRGALSPTQWFRAATARSVWDRMYWLSGNPRVRVVSWEPTDTRSGQGGNSRYGEFLIRNFNGEVGCTVTLSAVLRNAAAN